MGWRSEIVGSELDKKSVFEFFGAGRGGRWSEGEGVGVGVDRSGGSGSPGPGVGEKGGVGGKGQVGRGSGPPARNGFASTHGALLWVSGHKSSVLNRTKKVFLSFLGPGGGGPWSGGGGVVRSGGGVREKKVFFGGREGGSRVGGEGKGGGGVVRTTSRVRGFPGARPQRRGRRISV